MARIHIYCGDGKGKSTAAAGLSIRMAGQGKPVVYARFLKSDDSGEVPVLMGVKEIELIPCEKTFGFTWQMGEREKEEARRYYGEMFEKACRKACLLAENGKEDPGALLVLDEICAAVNGGFVEESALLMFLDGKPEGLEVVLTGRNPTEEMRRRADYITEMQMVKHPYTEGLRARRGVEY